MQEGMQGRVKVRSLNIYLETTRPAKNIAEDKNANIILRCRKYQTQMNKILTNNIQNFQLKMIYSCVNYYFLTKL